jgi:uncharacterized sporulation protein YeaH/YhbH (DUF444 family)
MDGMKKKKGRANETQVATMQASQAQAAIRRLRRRLDRVPVFDFDRFRWFVTACISQVEGFYEQ